MSNYKYKSINNTGVLIRGQIEAINEPDLEHKLSAMGLELITCKKTGNGTSFFQNQKIERKDIINFCFHMEQMTRAGVPLLDGLVDLRDSMENIRFQEALSAIIASIEGGNTFSEALHGFPDIFDSVFVSLIEAGEHAGQLDMVLHKMTDSLKWQDEIISKTKKLLIYPCVVGVVLLAVIFFLMIYLVPNLVSFIKNMGNELPFHTKLLISTSNFFVAYWYLILGAPILSFFTIRHLAKTNDKLKFYIDHLKLHCWLFGPVLKKIILARFATYFALLYKSGVTVLNCLAINEEIAGNLVIKNALKQIGEKISAGSTITQSVQQVTLFPPLVIRMLRVGENTGRLDESLDNVSYFYNREVNDSVDKMQSLIEMSMTVILGTVLAWVMISVLGPVYDIMSTIN